MRRWCSTASPSATERCPSTGSGPRLLTGDAIEDATAGLSQTGGWEVRPGLPERSRRASTSSIRPPRCATAAPPSAPPAAGPARARAGWPSPGRHGAHRAGHQRGELHPRPDPDHRQLHRGGAKQVAHRPALRRPAGAVRTPDGPDGVGDASVPVRCGRASSPAAWDWASSPSTSSCTTGCSGRSPSCRCCLSAGLLFSIIAFLGRTWGLTLTLAGIVGIIVSIGVVDGQFDRVLRERQGERAPRARPCDRWWTVPSPMRTRPSSRRTRRRSSARSILYLLSVGPVRGFALYLGLATLIDLAHVLPLRAPRHRAARQVVVRGSPALFGIPLRPRTDRGRTRGPRRGRRPGGGRLMISVWKRLYRGQVDIDFPRIWFKVTGGLGGRVDRRPGGAGRQRAEPVHRFHRRCGLGGADVET